MTRVTEIWTTHHVSTRLKTWLNHLETHGLTAHIRNQLNKIDHDMIAAFLARDKACLCTHTTPWSVELKTASFKVRFWKLWLSDIRRKTISTPTLLEIAEYLEWDPYIQPSLHTAQLQLRKCQKALKTNL